MSLLALAAAYDSEEGDEMGDPTPLSKRGPVEEKVRLEMSGKEEYAEPDSKKTKNMDGTSKELKTEYEEPTGLSLLKKDLKSEYGELVLLKKEVKSEHSDLEAEDKKQEPSVENLFHQKEVKSEYSELGAKDKEQGAYSELREEYCKSTGGTSDIRTGRPDPCREDYWEDCWAPQEEFHLPPKRRFLLPTPPWRPILHPTPVAPILRRGPLLPTPAPIHPNPNPIPELLAILQAAKEEFIEMLASQPGWGKRWQ